MHSGWYSFYAGLHLKTVHIRSSKSFPHLNLFQMLLKATLLLNTLLTFFSLTKLANYYYMIPYFYGTYIQKMGAAPN